MHCESLGGVAPTEEYPLSQLLNIEEEKPEEVLGVPFGSQVPQAINCRVGCCGVISYRQLNFSQ